jgi:hypothetical protein
MDLGEARGWNVWPLETGDWAWTAWTAANDRRSGIEPTEAEAESAAQRELEGLVSDAMAAALSRRELAVRDDRAKQWDPQS